MEEKEMAGRDLKNKPLVETMLEIQWRLESSHPAEQRDPHYKLLLGRFYDRVRDDYPEHEPLPTAGIPDEMVGHIVQHRFRVAAGEWPLVQIGPGVFTLNETSKYTWTDFERRAIAAVEKLFDSHPKVADLRVESLILRYIDAVEFDYSTTDVFDFLRSNLKVELGFPKQLFQGTGVDPLPRSSAWQTTFRCGHPPGMVHVNFATGQREGRAAILWETAICSSGDDTPKLPGGFPKWIEAAHAITSDWFFKLIEGPLKRRFTGE